MVVVQVFPNFAEYEKRYAASMEDPDAFWAKEANNYIDWMSPYSAVRQGGLSGGDVQWFVGGKLNVSHSCLDRHVAAGKGDQAAIIWEGDEIGSGKTLTYNELLAGVCRVANAMLAQVQPRTARGTRAYASPRCASSLAYRCSPPLCFFVQGRPSSVFVCNTLPDFCFPTTSRFLFAPQRTICCIRRCIKHVQQLTLYWLA